jgi:hypothetical protein
MQCEHNVAWAFLEARLFLEEQISPDKKNWKWG